MTFPVMSDLIGEKAVLPKMSNKRIRFSVASKNSGILTPSAVGTAV